MESVQKVWRPTRDQRSNLRQRYSQMIAGLETIYGYRTVIVRASRRDEIDRIAKQKLTKISRYNHRFAKFENYLA